MYQHKTTGVCARSVSFDIRDGKVWDVSFEGGCSGNTKGIAKLAEGMDAQELVARLSGIRCGMKPTSCPDQLAQAVKEVIG